MGFEALHSLYWLVVNLADQTPVLVLVDDCQWADRDSLRFLAYVAQRLEGLRVAMVLAGRPADSAMAEAGSLWAQVASRPEAIALYPQPLSESAAGAVVRDRLGVDAADEFCRSCHTATGGNPLFLRELLERPGGGGDRSAGRRRERRARGRTGRRHAVRPASGRRAAALGDRPGESGRGARRQQRAGALGARVGPERGAAREAADELVRADIFARAERLGFVHPIVRAALYEDLAPGERQARHAAAAEALAQDGASPERVTAHLLLTAPTGDERRVETLRSAARDAARHGAPGAAAARLRRALDESPGDEVRAEILAELGWYEVAAMQFEAAEEHLQACLASGASLTTRAQAASVLGRCAIVSGGRSADAAGEALASLAEELGPLDPERSLELRSELLMVATTVPSLRAGVPEHLRRFRDQAEGRPEFEAVATIHGAQEQFMAGGSAAAAVAEVEAALAAGLPPSAQTTAGLLALQCCGSGSGTTWRSGSSMSRWKAPVARATRRDRASSTGSAPRSRWRRGRFTTRRSRPRPGCSSCGNRISPCCSSSPWPWSCRSSVAMSRPRPTLPERETRSGVADDRVYIDDYLVARGRLRIAQDRVREGVDDLLWCGQRLEALQVMWPSDWRAFAAPALASLGEHERATQLAHEQVAMARRVGAPGALGMSLRTAGLAIGGDEGLALLQEAVSTLEDSQARLELAHALADLGAALSRAGRRRDGRDAERRAITLAGECGAIVSGRTRAGRAPGRAGASGPARADRAERADRGGVASVPSGGGGPHQPGGRAGAVRDGEDRRASPVERLPQARYPLSSPAGGSDRRIKP